MTDKKKLEQYQSKLTGCAFGKSESVFQTVADSFEDDLLEVDGLPEDYFNFVVQLFSEAEIYSKPGLWNFLLVLGTEKHKLHAGHYKALSKQIIENYEKYLDRDLCLAVCDFIARNYFFADAMEIFEQLALIESRKPTELQGFVNDGLRILAAEEKRTLDRKASPIQ